MSSAKTKVLNHVYSLEDYDDTYKFIIKYILSTVGIRMTRRDSAFVRLFWKTFYILSFANLFVPIFLDIITAYNIYIGVVTDENIVFMILPCMGYLSLALFKSHKMVTQRHVFENLISELRGMWPEGSVSVEEHAIISKATKELNIVIKGYYCCNMFLCVSVVAPSYVDIVRRVFGEDVPRRLPYFYYLPYDEHKPVASEITLAFHTSQTVQTLWYMLAGDLLFCTFLSHITTQFELLCIRIEKLFPVNVDKQLVAEYPLGQQHKETTENQTSFPLNNTETTAQQENELKAIIVRHNDLIRLATDVESLFSFTLLVNFLYSSLIICLCGFCSIVVEKWNSFMYKTFLATSLSQTWLLCWHGQKIMQSSEKVANALYNSGWYTAPDPIKKSVLFMICRSQKPVVMTTYGFSVISLTSYATIIKTSWSYFTLLLNAYD